MQDRRERGQSGKCRCRPPRWRGCGWVRSAAARRRVSDDLASRAPAPPRSRRTPSIGSLRFSSASPGPANVTAIRRASAGGKPRSPIPKAAGTFSSACSPPLRKLNGRKPKNSARRALSRGFLPFHFPSLGTLRPSKAQEDRFAWQRGANQKRDRAPGRASKLAARRGALAQRSARSVDAVRLSGRAPCSVDGRRVAHLRHLGPAGSIATG